VREQTCWLNSWDERDAKCWAFLFIRTKQSSPFLAASGSYTAQYWPSVWEHWRRRCFCLPAPCTLFVREHGLCAASFSICTPHFHSMGMPGTVACMCPILNSLVHQHGRTEPVEWHHNTVAGNSIGAVWTCSCYTRSVSDPLGPKLVRVVGPAHHKGANTIAISSLTTKCLTRPKVIRAYPLCVQNAYVDLSFCSCSFFYRKRGIYCILKGIQSLKERWRVWVHGGRTVQF
jgi:hypothetical protein